MWPNSAAEAIFWLSLITVLYVYAGFPLVLLVLGKMLRRPVRKAAIEPQVSLFVAAYNEGAVIEAKIRNALALDYPPDRIEIVIASDGSKDATVDTARRFESDPRVRIVAHPVNRGKLAVLNDGVRGIESEIIVFSDAASMLQPDAIRKLVRNFADPSVGAVSGIYGVKRSEAADIGKQEDFYWKYETFLKQQESALHSILGCHGSLYAIRRELYPYPDAGTINDDYVIPVRILQKGYRVVYDTDAVSVEEAHEMDGFQRRVRIMTGNFQQLQELRALAWPPRPLPLFFFLSHKAGRLVVPLAMLLLLGSNLFLLDRPFYLATAVLQAVFYALVLVGAAGHLRQKLLRLPYYFCMINAAAFLGMYYALFGRRRLAWK